MRSVDNQTPLNLVSEVSGLEDRYEGTHPQEDFSRLEFNEIIDLYYQPIYGLLNTARLVNNEIYLNDLDIQNLRFDKLYYIKEESSYFILNKIPNYIEEGLYNVSMLEVDYYSEEPNEPSLQPYITLQSSYLPANTPFTFNDSIVNNYAFVNYVSDGANLRARRITEPDPSGTYTGFEFNEVVNLSSTQLNLIFPIVIPAAQLGWYEIQITDINTLQSNIQYVFVGSDDTPQASIAVNLVDTGNVELPYPQRIRDIFFRFNNFTPLFCTFELQAYVSIGFPAVEGEIYNYTVPAAQLNEGVDNYLSTGVLDFATQWQYWRIIITTDLGTETRAAFMP
jgi:hypothetical protein